MISICISLSLSLKKMPQISIMSSTIGLTISSFPRTWISRRRRNLNSEKNKPRWMMSRMNCAGNGKEYWLGKSLKLSIHRPKIDKFTPTVYIDDDDTSEFEELEVYEARLNEEYWTAAWLRAECHWENRENERNAENFKWLFAEKEFVALKKRCDEQLGNKCKCILVVKKVEDGSGLVNRVVGTLDLHIRYFSQRQTFTDQEGVGVGVGAMNRKKSNSFAYISNLCVAKSARRRGVATIMLQHAISTAYNHGIKRVFLRVHGDNEAALTLYQNMGFKVVEAANSGLCSGQPFLLCIQASP